MAHKHMQDKRLFKSFARRRQVLKTRKLSFVTCLTIVMYLQVARNKFQTGIQLLETLLSMGIHFRQNVSPSSEFNRYSFSIVRRLLHERIRM